MPTLLQLLPLPTHSYWYSTITPTLFLSLSPLFSNYINHQRANTWRGRGKRKKERKQKRGEWTRTLPCPSLPIPLYNLSQPRPSLQHSQHLCIPKEATCGCKARINIWRARAFLLHTPVSHQYRIHHQKCVSLSSAQSSFQRTRFTPSTSVYHHGK